MAARARWRRWRLLKEHGYTVAVVSNQAGIGRGAMTEDDLAAIHERMRAEAGGAIEADLLLPARLGRGLRVPQAGARDAVPGPARAGPGPDPHARSSATTSATGRRPTRPAARS